MASSRIYVAEKTALSYIANDREQPIKYWNTKEYSLKA